MTKRFYKHKVLLDENMPVRTAFPRLNEHFDVKHVRDDLHQGETEDPDVYQLATVQNRILVTFNGDDFRPLVGALEADPGVMDVPAGWEAAAIDSKLTALRMRHGPKYFMGHYRALAT